MRGTTRIIILGAIAFLAGCSGDHQAGTGPASSRAVILLAVGPGVRGNPGGMDSLVVDSGTALAYSYAPMPGFGNLSVRLDGQDVSPTGTFEVHGRQVLEAIADSLLILGAADSAIVQAARAIRATANPYAAYLTFQGVIDSLIEDLGYAAAADRVAAIEAASFDPVQDSPLLAAILRDVAESTVAGRFGDVHKTSGSTGAGNIVEVVFLFVNGIWTSPRSYQSTLGGTITGLVSAAGFTDQAKYAVGASITRATPPRLNRPSPNGSATPSRPVWLRSVSLPESGGCLPAPPDNPRISASPLPSSSMAFLLWLLDQTSLMSFGLWIA